MMDPDPNVRDEPAVPDDYQRIKGDIVVALVRAIEELTKAEGELAKKILKETRSLHNDSYNDELQGKW